MTKPLAANQYIIKYPKFLFLLVFSYSMFVLMSNWYDSKLIEIFGMTLAPGCLIYSVTFLQANMITEVYGFKNARLAIYYALIFNLLFVVYGWLVMSLPSSSQTSSSFDDFLFTNLRIILSSFVSCCIAEPINALMTSKLKIYCQGKYVGIRFILSTLFSGLIDSMIFVVVAFYGVINNPELLKLGLNIWLIKIFVEISLLPIAVRISKKLKNIEKLDIYDVDTRFTFFSLDTNYTEKNNHFKFQ